ncbi:hypothetical protein CPJCM30710_15180 [Clostridium polyendosporum]|uniref:Uncharacterized protein n=1 Tax=Clostridium polyendosporum TaxID=69208 RepID=A0A919RZ05_9CLOT|nr:hypothetical protein CPJCM30710_15180 [Clostridium polyendosporum]
MSGRISAHLKNFLNGNSYAAINHASVVPIIIVKRPVVNTIFIVFII